MSYIHTAVGSHCQGVVIPILKEYKKLGPPLMPYECDHSGVRRTSGIGNLDDFVVLFRRCAYCCKLDHERVFAIDFSLVSRCGFISVDKPNETRYEERQRERA